MFSLFVYKGKFLYSIWEFEGEGRDEIRGKNRKIFQKIWELFCREW